MTNPFAISWALRIMMIMSSRAFRRQMDWKSSRSQRSLVWILVLRPSVIDEVIEVMPLNNDRDSPSSTTFDIDKQVCIALQSQRVAVPKHLWETGVWQLIFTNQNSADSFSVFGQELHRPSIFPGPVAATDDVEPSSKKARSKHRFDQVVRFKPDLTWKEQTDAALQSSVKLWYMLIGRWKRESAMYIELHEFRWEGDALTMLLDIFASRSPYTLRKRALALMHVCDYLELHWCPAFPIRERDMYAFLCHERESGQGRHHRDWRDTCNLSIFGGLFWTLKNLMRWSTVLGVVEQPSPNIERNQTSPLKVEEVKLLHSNLANGSELWDRMFSGAALFCLYARARWAIWWEPRRYSLTATTAAWHAIWRLVSDLTRQCSHSNIVTSFCLWLQQQKAW